MTRFPSITLMIAAAAACFIGSTDSLSSSSSSSLSSSASSASSASSSSVVETITNDITDVLHKTATAETERLFQYYNNNKNKNNQQTNTDDDNTTATKETGTGTAMITKPPTVWRSRAEAATYVRENIDTILFDCDGVLYRTTSLCPGASECIQGLLDMDDKRILFVTNNAGVNRRELREKLSKLLQIDSLTTDQMISSSYSSAQYLKGKLLLSRRTNPTTPSSSSSNISPPRVHVIGSSGLCEELVAAGFNVTGGQSSLDDNEPGSMSREELAEYDFDKLHPIDALVVGHDTDMSFRKLCIADNLLLRNPDALFVATNKDSFDVVDGNSDDDNQIRHIVGNGATVVALEYSSKRTSINVGKPSKELFELIRQRDDDHDHDDDDDVDANNSVKYFDDPSRCLFVGDRLDTDIRFGKDNGMKSLLVMTGVTTAETMEELANGTEEEPLPDFIVPYVGMLV